MFIEQEIKKPETADEEGRSNLSQSSASCADVLFTVDTSGVVRSNQLLVRGWGLIDSKQVEVTLLDENKNPIDLLGECKERRSDVLAQLNLDDPTLNPGFCQLYNVQLQGECLFFHVRSGENEVTLPFDVVEINSKEVNAHYMNNFSSFVDELPLIDDRNNTSRTNDLEDDEAIHIDSFPLPLNDSCVEKNSNISVNIEKAGIFKNKFVIVRGWCADLENNMDITFSVEYESVALNVINCFKRERLDVVESLGLSESNIQHGFLLIAELPENFNLTKSVLNLHCIAKTTHIISVLDVRNSIQAHELEDKLLDTNKFTLLEVKEWLLSNLGASYLSELKKDFISLNSIKSNITVETFLICGDNGVFLRGWLDNYSDSLAGVYLNNGTHLSSNLLPLLNRKIRPDVNEAFDHLPAKYKSGFYCFSSIKKESENLSILLIEKTGKMANIPLVERTAEDNEIEATQHVLADVEALNSNLIQCYENHIMPALHGIWANRVMQPDSNAIKEYHYGTIPDNPSCSVIVPLYGRCDFVLHQISQFNKDETLGGMELIYVLDDPRIEQELLTLCEDVAKLYPVPFKVITGGKNLGYAGANNFGVSQAKSSKLLLLNSDVIPSENGWLNRMLDKYDRSENIGAMGVKLVFEDETIQHIGMAFSQSSQFAGIWLNEHPYKGMPATLVPKIDFKQSNTVTAACLMIDKEKFLEVGGFETCYILGDFEDSDLCLKLIKEGYSNYVLGTEKLYHLERQSQSLVDQGDWKFKLTLFNGWQHTVRWNNTINEIREENV